MSKETCGCEMVGCNDYVDGICQYEKDYCKYNLPQEHELIEENKTLKAALAEKERELANRCDDCGAKLSNYPNGCPLCGAPVCCQQCCKIENLKAALVEKEKEFAEMREMYNELIMGVGKKFPDETRHQTALRYIIEREQNSNDCAAKTDRAAVEKEK